MNFTTPNSPTKSSSYQHRASYYAPNNGKYSRSPHHTSRTSFNSHSHPQAYHPRLINTQSLKLTAATPTATSTPSATPNTSPQQNTNQSQPPPQSQPSTPNHIKKNYHFAAKSSELFIKKKQLLSSRNTRFDALPATPQTHVHLLPLTRPTISFSSQHTPQSFIANQSSTPNNSPHNTLSTVSTASPSMVSHSNTTHNDYKNNRKSRWNYKAEHRSNANRHRHRSHRPNPSLSRSRSRSRSSKLCKKAQKSSDSELKSNHDSFTNHNRYTIRSDIHSFAQHKSRKTKANYAKQELQRQHNHGTYTYTLRKYMCRNHARRRKKNIKSRHKLHHQSPYDADADADDENENADGNGTDCMLRNYDLDVHDSDYAIYEPPFKKPRFMKKLKPFLSTQPMPQSLVRKISKLNRNLLSQRSKKRKQREQYIQIERAQSAHWNVAASKCWFIRCVHMLEGHVLTMCSSPDFASGVSYPRQPLDEIEKKLQRIHPLPPLIYGRLMKTLHNLSTLMREYPHVVQWDGAKLRSIFEKAIRKQLQMKGIYQFDSAQCVLEEYDFAPFALPQYERQSVSFYLERDGNARVHRHDARADTAQCLKRDESIEIGVGCIDEEEEENDEEHDMFIHKAHIPLRLRLQSQSRSVTPGMMSEMTPMLSSNQSRNNSLTPVICENVNKLPSYLHAKQKRLHLNVQSDDLVMETHLNMDLVRKSKVTFNLNENKFVVSPKIEKLVSANCQKLAQEDIETHSRLNVCKDTVKETEIEKEAEPGNKPRKYTWIIETLDSNDESIDVWLRQKKQTLLDVFAHNGVYGHIKAIGLEPTYCELPTFGQHGYEDLDGKRLPSLYYLISKYVDCSNPWYIRMLLKYFDVETHKYCAAKLDAADTDLSCLFLRKYVHKEPKSLRYAFIGTVQDKDAVHSTVVLDIYMDIKDKECYIRLRLNEDKRHKLLCLLLRIKNKYKHNRHTDTRCIPQPPPPPEDSGSVENSKRILLMNAICVNYNWNGYCEATYCNKKHECCCCGEKHPARICGKQCIDYNWAKCLRLCPKNKQHSCSQCGDSKHPAWRCQYLHRSVTERYYAIYKTKKLRNGYFKLLEKKEKKKNIEWINRRYKPLVGVGNGSVIHVNNNRHQQQRHHYLNSQKGKKRSSRK